jgi:hypothetical protein
MYPDSSEARNPTAHATSLGCPGRHVGPAIETQRHDAGEEAWDVETDGGQDVT